jgi:16S rRNA (cytosine1402-N4)-methyltransferase
MSGRGEGDDPAAGGPAPHVPVLLAEVLTALKASEGGVFLDGTFGAGGYARAILDAHPQNRVVGVDRDPSAIAAGQEMVAAYRDRLQLVEGRFGDCAQIARDAGLAGKLDGIVLDIGVSSMQLDQAARGFSFRFDGPLDMRMAGQGESAADLVNDAEESLLADIIYHYGEERRARAIARAIIERRRRAPFETTRDFAELVSGLVRAEPNGPHPATRTFQALRIAVNDELGELARALHGAEEILAPGGRLVVVTFHSLEDRIVKQYLAQRAGRGGGFSRHIPVAGPGPQPSFRLVTKGPVKPGSAESAANPRARSAKLRAGERLDAPAQPESDAITTLASLPRTAREKGRR